MPMRTCCRFVEGQAFEDEDSEALNFLYTCQPARPCCGLVSAGSMFAGETRRDEGLRGVSPQVSREATDTYSIRFITEHDDIESTELGEVSAVQSPTKLGQANYTEGEPDKRKED